MSDGEHIQEALVHLMTKMMGASGFMGETLKPDVLGYIAKHMGGVDDIADLPVERRARILWLVAAGYSLGRREMFENIRSSVEESRP